YTSGSTGVPKGVMIPHRALYNHMLWMLEEFAFSLEDRVLQKTPYSFDASVWEIFAPLMSGARLVMARPGGHQDVAYLIDEIKAKQITVLQVVPSLLQALLDAAGIEECKSLTRVFSGGEVLTSEEEEGADRETDQQRARVCVGRADGGSRDRHERRVVHRRRECRERVCGKRGADGREVRAGPVQRERRRAVVPDGRRGAVSRRWSVGV